MVVYVVIVSLLVLYLLFFFSSRRRHTRCALVTGVQTCALPICKGLIYPFGVNESQLAAVERAFSAQISAIEGPPGTGKTQTILNILANILLRGQIGRASCRERVCQYV